MGQVMVYKVAAIVGKGEEAVEAFLKEHVDDAAEKAKQSKRGQSNVKLDKPMLAKLDELIQTELAAKEERITAHKVKCLAKDHLDVAISVGTATRALNTLGYAFHLLKRKYKYTSKRVMIIEDFICEYSRVRKHEKASLLKEVIRAWCDESYAYKDTKWNYGWTPDGRMKHADVINNVLVEDRTKSTLRMGDRAAKKGTRVVFLCAQTVDGVLAQWDASTDTYADVEGLKKQTWQTDVSVEHTTTSWAWQCGQQGHLKDHHNDFDVDMYWAFVTKRLLPSFKKRYWVNGHKPGMCLIIDGAPYHKQKVPGGLALANHNKNSPPNQSPVTGFPAMIDGKPTGHDQRSLVQIAADLGVQSVTLLREGQQVVIAAERFKNGKNSGPTDANGNQGLSVEELRSGIKQWILNSPDHKHLLQTRLEKLFAEQGEHWSILHTPPYAPKMQPIELLWRDTKGFVRNEWSFGRSTKDVASDICDYWFGCEASRYRKVKKVRYGPAHAASHIKEAEDYIDWWIDNGGFRCSGTLEDLKYAKDLEYDDDGSLQGIISNDYNSDNTTSIDTSELDDNDLVGDDDQSDGED